MKTLVELAAVQRNHVAGVHPQAAHGHHKGLGVVLGKVWEIEFHPRIGERHGLAAGTDDAAARGEPAGNERQAATRLPFPVVVDDVEERLGLIHSLTRKYGGNIETVLEHAEAARLELETITHAEARLQALEAEEGELLVSLGEIGADLSRARRDAIAQLEQAIEDELADLRMAGAQFGVKLSWEDDPQGAPVGERWVAFSSTGLDQVEFLIAPNPGEGLKPLVKIASGGETSRMMLGLKSVLVRADRTPTLIFDEIDQGIGGRVGSIVGRKLWGLAQNHQVLCVTHLPQLGAYGDQHYKVEKQVKKGRTVTLARALTSPERIPELALMLGGVSEPNLESAADLMRQAIESKRGEPSIAD